MTRLGGANEIVVGQTKGGEHFAKLGRVLIGERLRSDAALLGTLLHLCAVLIGSSEEEHITAIETHCARPHITQCGGVRVTDVRSIVDVVNRRGDVCRRGAGHRLIVQNAPSTNRDG